MTDYFTVAELRALPDMDNVPKYPDERLEAARDWIVAIVERVCGTSFVVKSRTSILTGRGYASLVLPSPYVREVTAADVGGNAIDPANLLLNSGVLSRIGGAVWTSGLPRNVTVTYLDGYSDEPPADLKEAMLRAARNWLLTMHAWSGVDERQTAITNEFGNVNLATPGEGRPTGLPMVDATIMGWAEEVRLPGIA